MKLHDVAATPDGRRLLGVGTLLESCDGLQPSKSRAEKRIIGELTFSVVELIMSLTTSVRAQCTIRNRVE